MQIETAMAILPLDRIQAAYNEAVLSGRMLVAEQVARLWLDALTRRSMRRKQRPNERRETTILGLAQH